MYCVSANLCAILLTILSGSFASPALISSIHLCIRSSNSLSDIFFAESMFSVSGDSFAAFLSLSPETYALNSCMNGNGFPALSTKRSLLASTSCKSSSDDVHAAALRLNHAIAIFAPRVSLLYTLTHLLGDIFLNFPPFQFLTVPTGNFDFWIYSQMSMAFAIVLFSFFSSSAR